MPLAHVQSGAVVSFKGSGQVIDLFSHFVDEWFTVGKVCKILAKQAVFVHRNSVRDGLAQLCAMGFIEKKAAEKKRGAPDQFRRALTEAQREYREKQQGNALAAAIKSRVQARVQSRQARAASRV